MGLRLGYMLAMSKKDSTDLPTKWEDTKVMVGDVTTSRIRVRSIEWSHPNTEKIL